MIKSKKDFKIIQNVIENARIPLTELAKKTRLSREVVQYRLKQLESSLVIGYQARINLAMFFQATYTLFLNIQGVERNEAVTRLKSLPSVQWAASSGGRWNYILTFSTSEQTSLSDFLDLLTKKFNKYLIGHNFTQHLKEYKDTFAGLFEIKTNYLSNKPAKSKVEIDETDKKILSYLTKDARLSNEEIAQKCGITRETVRNRIKNLEKSEVILGYRAIIRPQALELENYILAIKTNTINSELLVPLCNFLVQLSECSYVGTTAGEVSILATISTKSLRELDEIINKIQNEHLTIIKEIEPLPLFELSKQTYASINPIL